MNQSILDTVQQKQTELAETQASEEDMPYEGPMSKVILEDETPSIVEAKDTAEYLKVMLHAEKQETQRYSKIAPQDSCSCYFRRLLHST